MNKMHACKMINKLALPIAISKISISKYCLGIETNQHFKKTRHLIVKQRKKNLNNFNTALARQCHCD